MKDRMAGIEGRVMRASDSSRDRGDDWMASGSMLLLLLLLKERASLCLIRVLGEGREQNS